MTKKPKPHKKAPAPRRKRTFDPTNNDDVFAIIQQAPKLPAAEPGGAWVQARCYWTGKHLAVTAFLGDSFLRTITHRGSGFAVMSHLDQDDAKRLAKKLDRLPWTTRAGIDVIREAVIKEKAARE